MALKIELVADKDRGPGHGLMRISPFAADGTVSVLVQRNQDKESYLAGGGQWSNQEVWHEVPASTGADGVVVLALGPDVVDPIATQPGRVMLQATVKAGAARDSGRMMLRGLLPSVAAGRRPEDVGEVVVHGAPPAPVQEPEPELPVQPEPEPEQIIIDAPHREEPAPKPPTNWLIPGIAAAVVVVLLGVGGAWFAGLLPLGQSEAALPEPVVAQDTPAAPATLASLQDINAFIQTNPTPDAAFDAAQTLLGGGKVDLAMLVFQYAARQGNPKAAVAVARMYDPDTWSAQTSPMGQADAETAAYWYEPAAQAGDPEAQRQLGKILISVNPSGFQHDKGKEWLTKAADAGDAGAKALLEGN